MDRRMLRMKNTDKKWRKGGKDGKAIKMQVANKAVQ